MQLGRCCSGQAALGGSPTHCGSSQEPVHTCRGNEVIIICDSLSLSLSLQWQHHSLSSILPVLSTCSGLALPDTGPGSSRRRTDWLALRI
ncbi:hypothetical protein VTK73DRAFT_1488 [Phialemonium thermophilum]|uniref:Uncharacterized protein n=1 Tax=Phialemonium thermophilum TaxID=223376 RepID=A0ABR3VTE2_9PEZI